MDEKKYELDRNELKSMTFEEADDHVSYWDDKTQTERLNAACVIINQILIQHPLIKLT